MTMRFSGKTAIVTGAASGIGAVYARELAREGANVVIADVLTEAGEALARALNNEAGAQAIFVKTDVTSEEDTARMAQTARETFGSLDILVNNAALYSALQSKKHFAEITAQEWDRVMAVNAKGVWLCVRAVYPYMRQRGYGKIINIASAVVDNGAPGFAHYVASKAAVVGLTRALAKEMGSDNIRVNAIAPGLVSNESSRLLNRADYLAQLAQGRAIKREMLPEDLVGVLLFLASPESDFITGQTCVVDGGVIMH
jgi:NAD(P)-dependent dehydrogenase (short-subunit alcohol dehydrogenase family)